MRSRVVQRSWLRPSILTLASCLALLCLTGAGTSGNDTRDNTSKPDNFQNLEQKTLSLAPPLVQATVGLTIMGGMGAGSGVIVSEDGLILTAGHVVPPPGREMIVHFSDGKRVKARAMGADKHIDAGLAKIIDEGKYPFVKMGKSSTLKKGDWVMAIGNPGGYRPDRKPPIRLGRVLSLPNRDAGLLWIRTDASVAPGDSGGPLFNMDGDVVGIHSNISPDPSENRHVAIDDYTKRWDFMMAGKVTGRMFSNGTGSRAQLGIQPADKAGKVIISDVVAGTNADKAGLKVGDVILEIDGSEINKADEVFAKLRNKRTGNTVKLLIERDGEEKTISAKMQEGPRTFENPTDDVEQFLKKYGYQRTDGVWEYQPTDENEAEYKELMEKIAKRRKEAIASGEFKPNTEITKNSPQFINTFTTVSKPSTSSIAVIYNGIEGNFEDKPSALGTIISKDGYILTKASELKDEFYCKIGDKEFDGKLITKRPDYDLALIKVEAKDLKPINWASQSEPSPGTLTVTPTLKIRNDTRAVVLGIVSNTVREIGSSLSANKAVLGVQFALDSDEPILDVITPKGPAETAGIKKGDLILSVNGKVAKTREKIQSMLKPMKPGDKVELEIKRGMETLKLNVTLGSRSETFAAMPQADGRRGLGGFQEAMFERMASVNKRKEDFPEVITHDAALKNFEMGGPLLNLAGQAIGLNIARFDRTGSYAITYKTLQPIIEKMIAEAQK